MRFKKTFMRIIPVGLSLSPIGILFGVMAAQVNWSYLDVFLMSLLGFTGSGQFMFLGYSYQGIENYEYFTIFIVILSMNLRYIPMTLSASSTIRCGVFKKGLLSHWLADESFAIEKSNDSLKQKSIIRITIVFFWTISTTCGVLFSDLFPSSVKSLLTGLTFPISSILILLSYSNIINFIEYESKRKRIELIFLCILVSVFCISVIGPEYFWIPGIFISYLILINRENNA